MWDAVMQMDHTNLIKILLQSVSSILITLIELVSENQIKDIDFVSRKICSLSHAIVGLLEHDCSVVVVDEERAAVDERRRALTVTDADAEAVVASLGLSGWRRGEERVDAMAVVEELMESKRASEAELEEAFYVFDHDKDGFISATELRNVMRRLGFEEGEELADCEKMIGAFDDDGDGRISFREFASMMNNAV